MLPDADELHPHGISGRIGRLAWGPDGKHVAVAVGQWSAEEIDIWELGTLKLARRISVPQPPPQNSYESPPPFGPKCNLAWSPDGQVLAISDYREVSLWNAQTGSMRRRLPIADGIHSISWSRDGELLRIGTMKGVQVLRRDNDALVPSVAGPCQTTTAACLHLRDETERWQREEATFHAMDGVDAVGEDLILSPDARKLLAAFRNDGVGRIWDLESGRVLTTFDWRLLGTYVWSPNGEVLAHPARESLQLINAADASQIRSIRLPLPIAMAAESTLPSWSPDGKRILLADTYDSAVVSLPDGAVEVIKTGTGTPIWNPAGVLVRLPIRPSGRISLSSDFRHALAQEGVEVKTWFVEDGQTKPGPKFDRAYASAWSPDSHRLAYISASQTVEIWDIDQGRVVERWTAPGSFNLRYLAWPDKLIAVENLRGALRIWREP